MNLRNEIDKKLLLFISFKKLLDFLDRSIHVLYFEWIFFIIDIIFELNLFWFL